MEQQPNIEAAIQLLTDGIPQSVKYYLEVSKRSLKEPFAEQLKTLNEKLIAPANALEQKLQTFKGKTPAIEGASENLYFDVKRLLESYGAVKQHINDMVQLQQTIQQRSEEYRNDLADMLLMLASVAEDITNRMKKRIQRNTNELGEMQVKAKAMSENGMKALEETKKRFECFEASTFEMADTVNEHEAANKPLK